MIECYFPQMTESTWTQSGPVRKMGSGLIQGRLEQSLKVLEKLGVVVPHEGRHRKALAVLEGWNASEDPIDLADRTLTTAIEAAHRTAWDTFFIAVAAEHRSRRPNSPFTAAKLQLMMGGSDVDEGQDVEPKNTEFELYVAATLVLGGLSVFEGPPDLQFDFGTHRVGVEAKRIKSLNPDQIKKHCRKARDQIKTSGIPGWIALNIDTRFDSIALNQPEADLFDEFDSAFDEANQALAYVSPNTEILGFMLFGHTVSWSKADEESPPRVHTAFPTRWVRLTDREEDEAFFAEFQRGVMSRLEVRRKRIASPDFAGRL